MTLLARVSAVLARAGIEYALIGAGALAVHGVSRSTVDQDLLALDTSALEPATWRALVPEVSMDIRMADADDPLGGVIRFRSSGERDVDLVLGRGGWLRDVLARAVRVDVGDAALPVVTAADLVLLKLYAGGSQDRWDIEQLLAADESGGMRREIETRLPLLPARCRELWDALFRARES